MLFDFDLYEFAQQLKTKVIAGKMGIFDPIRQIYTATTPEEIVRQSLILKLKADYNIPFALMMTEQRIKVGNLNRRVDLLVYNRRAQPVLIAETKAPTVRLTQKTGDQIAVYNSAIFAPCLLLANGIKGMFFEIDFKQKKAISRGGFSGLNID